MGAWVQTYMTTERYVVENQQRKSYELPPGTFVKMLNPYYLPEHIKESDDYKYYNPKVGVFCYCHAGIVLIPIYIIREA